MSFFISKSVHRIDRKGRVSVPAAFRAELETESFHGVALFPPFTDLPCIEGCGATWITAIGRSLEAMHPLSAERDALARLTLAETRQLAFDGEGRIVLPVDFIARAGLEDQALFAGLGAKFQIWRPETYNQHSERVAELARANVDKLPWDAGGVARGGGEGDRDR